MSETYDQDDELYALKWADERKRRIKCEERLLAMQREAMYLATAAEELVNAALATDDAEARNITGAIAKITDFAMDVIIQSNLNVVDPVYDTPEGYDEQLLEAHRTKSLAAIDEAFRDQMGEAFDKAVKACRERWEALCEEHDWVTISQFQASIRAEVMQKMIRKAHQGSGEQPTAH